MRALFKLILIISTFLIFAKMAEYSWADVVPGDMITKENYEKIKGMVPDAVLNWVKKGDMVLNIGKLTYNPAEYFSSETLESFKSNKEKYALDDKDGIIEGKTGKIPDFIIGIPFPDIDPKDSKFSQKLAYNGEYIANIHGHMLFRGPIEFIGRSGYEKEIITDFRRFTLDGYPGASKVPNPENAEFYEIVVVREPYDMAGIATLSHRFKEPAKMDLIYNYLPQIRRTRRASPANRSENFASTDFAIDDLGVFAGKISDFEWKFLEEKEVLVPYLGEKPGMVKKIKGDWETTGEFGHIILGYQKKGWKGAPWAMTNVIWVKQKAYVSELKSRDAAYNYGIQQMWTDASTFLPVYKIIYDRDNNHWKTETAALIGLDSSTGEKRFMWYAAFLMVDELHEHASFVEATSDKNKFIWPEKLNTSDFSLGGFAKFCK